MQQRRRNDDSAGEDPNGQRRVRPLSNRDAISNFEKVGLADGDFFEKCSLSAPVVPDGAICTLSVMPPSCWLTNFPGSRRVLVRPSVSTSFCGGGRGNPRADIHSRTDGADVDWHIGIASARRRAGVSKTAMVR